MIFCNECGSEVEDGMRFCSECGTAMRFVSSSIPSPPSSLPVPPPAFGEIGLATAPAMASEREHQQNSSVVSPVPAELPITGLHGPRAAAGSKALVGILGGIAVVAIAVAVYFALSDSPTSRLAASLRAAVDNGRLVTLSNDDAYTYYFQLKGLDPANKAVTEAGTKVMPRLREMGDEVLQRRMSVQTEDITDREWSIAQYVFEWAHSIDPSNKVLEAKRLYAEGEVAKSQNRLDDAERSFRNATQLNPSWALPHNRLGLLCTERKRFHDAIKYYERAIQIEPGWEFPHNNLGTAYFNLRDFGTAERYYQRAIELNPTWARPHYWLGEIYERKAETHPQALAEYQRVRELDPGGRTFSATLIEKKIERLHRY